MSKSRVEKYRNKLKNPENAEKCKEVQEKVKISSKIYREKKLCNPETAENFRKRRAMQVAECRKKKKLRMSVGYELPRSLRKATKRIDSQLPKDLKKKKQIIQRLGEKYLSSDEAETASEKEDEETAIEDEEIAIEEEEVAIEEEENVVSVNEKHQNVKSFYLRDDISRTMPGMKNYTTIRSEGKKEKVQTRFMTMSCDSAYEQYKSENIETISVKRSLFYSLRPQNVLPASKTPHDVCSCRYHQDMSLMFDSLRRFFSNNDVSCMKELTIKLVCCTDNYQCMSGQCKECDKFVEKLRSYLDLSKLSVETTLVQWETSGIPRRINSTVTLQDLLDQFIEKFRGFKLHSYITNVQHKAFREFKDKIQV